MAIRCPGTGPFALASYFVGTEPWLLEVGLADAGFQKERLPAIHHALELASDALIAFGLACWQAGADIIQCGDLLSSCDVISPHAYQRFAMPYQHKVFRAWRRHGITGSLLHICGDSTRVLRQYRDTAFLLGSGCLVPRRTPLENVRALVAAAHEHVCR